MNRAMCGKRDHCPLRSLFEWHLAAGLGPFQGALNPRRTRGAAVSEVLSARCRDCRLLLVVGAGDLGEGLAAAAACPRR